MTLDRFIFHVAYAVAWLVHWPILALGGAGMGITCLAGMLARVTAKGLRLVHLRAYPPRNDDAA